MIRKTARGLVAIVALALISTAAHAGKKNRSPASSIKKSCYARAADFAERDHGKGRKYYDADGFDAFKCEIAQNNKVVICEVGASKGGGEAHDTYRVVMNRDCWKSHRVELIGEE